MISGLKHYQLNAVSPFDLKHSSLLTDIMLNLSTYSNNYFTQFTL